MKIFGFLFSVFILGFFVVGGFAAYGVYLYLKPVNIEGAQLITIRKGSGVSMIASQLDQSNIISNPLIFKIAVKLGDVQKDLKAGEYVFEGDFTMQNAIDKIVAGDIVLRQITFPEGRTSYEIIRQLNNYISFQDGEKITQTPPEGSLYPDTYRYEIGATKQDILSQMTSAMDKAIETAWAQRSPSSPVKSRQELVILASIIEKETGIGDERRRVAGVFANRLKKGMPLQTDPTVIYAITKGAHKNDGKGPLGRRLLRKDLQIESPYNTYKYAGLPAGPICNPGLKSLLAAGNPEQHDYLYFVADGTGGHLFGKTLKEHNENVAKWRKIRDKKD